MSRFFIVVPKCDDGGAKKALDNNPSAIILFQDAADRSVFYSTQKSALEEIEWTVGGSLNPLEGSKVFCLISTHPITFVIFWLTANKMIGTFMDNSLIKSSK